MSSNTIVPDNDSSRCPLHSGLNILRICDMVIEKPEEVIALFLFIACNTSHELLVYEQSLFTSGRVCPDHGVSVGNGIASHNAAASESVLCLLVGRVNSLETVQTLLELWR